MGRLPVILAVAAWLFGAGSALSAGSAALGLPAPTLPETGDAAASGEGPPPAGAADKAGIPDSIAKCLAEFTAPRSALRAYLRGRRRAVRGRLPRARQLFEKAVTYYPGYASAWTDLGRVYQAIGDVRRASEAYRKALKLDPEAWRAYAGLAELAADRGDWKEAAAASNRALEIMPSGQARLLVVNAMARYALGDLAGARRSAEKAVESAWVEPDPEAYLVLGLVAAREGRFREAAAKLKLYLSLDPAGDSAHEAREQLARAEAEIRKETGEQPEFVLHPSGMLVKNAAHQGSK